jgi:hypothetical protein
MAAPEPMEEHAVKKVRFADDSIYSFVPSAMSEKEQMHLPDSTAQTRDFLSTFGSGSEGSFHPGLEYLHGHPVHTRGGHHLYGLEMVNAQDMEAASTSIYDHLKGIAVLQTAPAYWQDTQAHMLQEQVPQQYQHLSSRATPLLLPASEYFYSTIIPNEYHVPWEYTMPVSSHVDCHSSDEMVYESLTEEQTLVINEHVYQTRPFSPKYIQKQLAKGLTCHLAQLFLSGNAYYIDAALEELFPLDVKKQSAATPAPWMTGLSKTERIGVIKRLAEALLQNANALRAHFLSGHVTPGMARMVLNAASLEECRQLARRYGLMVTDPEKGKNWQRGLNVLQRKALRYRVLSTHIVGDIQAYNDMVRKERVPPGYGLELLRANEEEFREMVVALKGRGKLPPLKHRV